jgi:hypothetical protein
MDLDPAFPFDSGLGGKIRHLLERANVFPPAIRVTAVVELIGAKENISGFNAFRQSQSKRQENRIARRDIGKRRSKSMTR